MSAGFEVSEERAAAGFMAEIAYYLDHHLEGSDRERLERLRDRCAEEMRRALELPDLDHATARRAMLGALEFRPYPDVLPTLGELRERGLTVVIASNWDCSLPEWLGPAGIIELVDGVVTSAEVGAPKPNTRVFERALAIAGVEPAEALHVGDKVDNDVEGARAAGVRGDSPAARGRPAAQTWRPFPRFGSSPPYSDWPWSTLNRSHAAPARAPGAARGGRAALAAVVRGRRIPRGADLDAHRRGHRRGGHRRQHDDANPTFTVVATFLQGVIFIGTAVLFASFAGKPRARQFGLRPARFWPTVGWAALGLFSFYILAALYTAIVQPDAEQTVAQDLGADQGTLGRIAAGFMIICIAPVAEEFFFRGFFYRALRSRYSMLVAALIDGLLFGVIHWDFSSADALLIVPPLAALGFMFCLVYERTGSLYPVIALHALNNAIAFAVTIRGPRRSRSCSAR